MSNLRFDLGLLILASGWCLALIFCGLFIQARIKSRTRTAMFAFWSHSIVETMGHRNQTAKEMALEVLALATDAPHRPLLELEESFTKGGHHGELISIRQVHRG